MIGAKPEVDGSLAGAAQAVSAVGGVRRELGRIEMIRFDRDLKRSTGWSWNRWAAASVKGDWEPAPLELLAVHMDGLAADARADGRQELADRLAEGGVGAARAATTLREFSWRQRSQHWLSGRKW